MDSNGVAIGGCIGFLKSLQKICRKSRPHEIVICWDGIGGSQKRKAKNKNYKAGRKPLRFNRRMIQLDEKSQEENKIYQQIRLFEYLNEMPIIQISIDGIEADDIIGYISKHKHYKGWQKIIISSDKDFFQLCDEETVVYRPIRDEMETETTLVYRFGIHPNNFALARAMVGDKSDNLPGINRIGMKTVSKNFSFLSESKKYDIEDIISACQSREKKLVVHKNIINGQQIIEDNYSMMQLYKPDISFVNKKSIDFHLKEFEPEFNKLEVVKFFHKDGLGSLSMDGLYVCMRKVCESFNKN
jgi:DNA polymerase-1